MQPYFFPYIGYFQLINAVDEFVVYDNIEFTKKGWINRNRILVNGSDSLFSLPIKKASDFLHIKDRFLADTWGVEKIKMLNRISESYRKAPYFSETYDLIERCLKFEDGNLFNFIFNSIQEVIQYLNIDTKLFISSSLNIEHNLKSDQKVMAICKVRGADKYLNPIGGLDLYDKEKFMKNNIELHFLNSNQNSYLQFNNEFIPSLSIIDVMMFNSKGQLKQHLNNYVLI